MRYEKGFRWKALNNQKIVYINVFERNAVAIQWAWSDTFRIYSRGYSGNYFSNVGNGWKIIIGDVSDGKWHYFEVHLKMDTNGNNGIAGAWIDGIKKLSYSNANFGAATFDYILIGSNGFEPNNSCCMYVDFADIVIGTTWLTGAVVAPSLPTQQKD